VDCKRTLLMLYRQQRLARSHIGGGHVYLSTHPGQQRRQTLQRQELSTEAAVTAPRLEAVSDELRAAIILFFSLLDERQRRLYAGLESHKFGHGGDRKLAELVGLDVHTVARGRRELLGGEVDRERIRRQGAGRKPVEKKHRTSSPPSSG